MGKTKTKYPVDIVIEFIFLINGQQYQTTQFVLRVMSSPIRYSDIRPSYDQFVNSLDINYPTVMEYILNDEMIEITDSFEMDVSYFMQQFGGKITIIVQDHMKAFMDEIRQAVNQIYSELDEIKQRLNEMPTKDELENMRKNNMPLLLHNQSTVAQLSYEQKQIDLGVLFSEPIFDEIRKRTAANPVDFRSEIQRLHTALKVSMKSEITLKCEIATKQNLKHLIKYSKPKILHIICHGTKQGALQFEDDSRTVVGTLQIVQSEQIVQILRTVQMQLPDVVFINSCYSQTVGQKFFQMGVNYVIMIDSEDTIEDEAAQIFSQHFYRNIFSGEKVKEAFKQAQQRVKMKHNFSGCCCRHASKETHKPDCRWNQMIKKNNIVDEQEKQQKHKLFHVPSQTCVCELKNLNRHKLTCEWAKQSLFHINNDFRKIDENGNVRFPKSKDQLPKYLPKDFLVICCCFNYQGDKPGQCIQYRMPHSQSNKFKILQKMQNMHSESLFSIVPSPHKQLMDYTSPQLVQTHQKIESSILGRQKQIYDFMKRIKDLNQAVYIVHGRVGVGRTSFALKSTTYLIERRIFEMYFYIDLYAIKDKDIFRYKFNQITKFNYDGDGQIKLKEVKNKMIIIILDNADDFFQLQRDQLYEQLKNLKQELHKTKIIVTFKTQNCNAFDFEKIHCQKFGLDILSIPVATRLIFTKMRHIFDVNVQYLQIDGLVRLNQTLRIPKIIESICQSFSSVKKKIKVADIKKKLQTFVQGESVGAQLIEENLNILKEKSQESYQLLLFISQFSEGITMDDFKMLSLYDRKDSKVHLPISKNWQSNFERLFQKIVISQDEKQVNSSSKINEQPQLNTPTLKNMHSVATKPSINAQKQPNSIFQKTVKGESYFLDEVGQNRFIVKRILRDFIWKKHISQSNLNIKHLFVGYMAVMLEIYFKQLVNQKYLHEDLMEYSAISIAGLFADKTNRFDLPIDLTESVRYVSEYKSQLERIICEHPSILEKIRKSDPSVFITNHKHDFLNIYQKKWDVVIEFLKLNKRNQARICVGYLQSLMIFIPTAFKIAKVQESLLKYVISKSMSLLDKLRPYSQQRKILIIQLKLQLMRASIELQKADLQSLRMDLDFNKQFTIKLIEKIDKATIQQIRKKWSYQKKFILMYKQYVSKKQNTNSKSFLEKNNKISLDKLKSMIKSVSDWLTEKWDGADQILLAKRNLVIGLVFLKILKGTSGAVSEHTTDKLKKDCQKDVLQMVKQSAQVFKNNNLIKLCLKAKITAIELYSQKQNLKKKMKIRRSIQFYQQLSQKQYQIMQCDRIYTDRKNNLIGFAQFQIQIKSLSKTLKQKLWQQSSNTLVCMKAVPITIDGKSPIIENLPRKKNNFRKQIEKVLNPQIDLCSKFEILTRQKLKEQVQNGCTILLLSANVKSQSNRTYLIFQGVKMEQDLVEINSSFVQVYDMKKIKILIIAGKNASLAIKQLNKVMEDPPIMISLGKTQKEQEQQNKFKEFKEVDDDKIQNKKLLIMQQRKKAEVTFLKEFIKHLMLKQINSNQQVVKICDYCSKQVMQLIDVDIEYIKRRTALKIVNIKGSYKDLSPGYQKNHNIDMKIKTGDSNFVCLRRWKQTYRVFDYLQRCADNKQLSGEVMAAYINVFGEIGSGKSSFVEEIARILVERERFVSGVYIIDGNVLEKKYQGQFQAYFAKESESGKIMNLEDFQIRSDEQLMLIVDDFHVIKPRSNGRFYLFLQKIIERKVNLIIVTQQQQILKRQSKKQNTLFKRIKPIQIQRLDSLEIDLIAYNTLDFSNQMLLNEYLQLKESKQSKQQKIVVEDIMKLRKIQNNGMKKTSSNLVPQSRDMRKLISYQN